ncbi:glycosyltransferase family 4 protein [Candidatus Jordarchaeum sp.]|uniref:glycosyltransferase family 4 protein n=1 Tax=Candidatus Jordarchaeum sp. TaxID=2823881 RepID=UPI00404B5C59
MPYHILENRGGGAEVQAWLLAKELARRGFEVSYIAQSVRGKAGKIERINGVTIRWVRYAHYFRWANGWEYYRALRIVDPDIVVERMTSFVTGIIGFYKEKYGKKFAWICTDNESPRRWHFLKNQIKTNKANKVGTLKSLVFLLNAIIYDLSRHYGMKKVTWVFTQNESQKKLLKREFGLASFEMLSGHEIPEHVFPIEQRLSNKIILWVANLGPKKRPELFIELARISENKDLKFIMIGGRDDKEYIRKLFKDVPNNLLWLGRLPFDETLSWFDKATAFINTSPTEGFPNTFVQAWVRGIPVITLGVNPDGIIEKYYLGYVASDEKEALKFLIFLIGNPDNYKRISKNAFFYASKNHSIKVAADNFLKTLGITPAA